jgi:signal transduction histidine kinase
MGMALGDQTAERLRQWPRTVHESLRSLLPESLAACAAIFSAAAATAVWENLAEPGLTIATQDRDGFRWIEKEDPSPYLPLVAERLDATVFDDDGKGHVVTAGETLRLDGVSATLRREFAPGRVISFPVAAENIEGRVFVVGPAVDADEGLQTAAALAPLFDLSMSAALRFASLREQAASEERTRVARDLHDGLLQSFTGIVLQLETVHALLGHDPQEAARVLTKVQAAIMSDQRELRAYVESLRPRRRRGELVFDFGERIEEMRRRFEAEWGIRLRVDSGTVGPVVGGALGQETFRIVQEAVTNSAKHGGASRIDVHLRTREGMLLIDVTDDGNGLAIQGRLTLAEMKARGIAPSSLGDRVAALNGELTVQSDDSGLRLEIAVPLGFSER